MTESIKKFFKIELNRPEKSPLEKFREKMWVLKRHEEKEPASGTDHFKFINPDDLDDQDMKIYAKIIDRDINIEELFNIIQERKKELTQSGNRSQKEFSAYLSNLVQGRMDVLR